MIIQENKLSFSMYLALYAEFAKYNRWDKPANDSHTANTAKPPPNFSKPSPNVHQITIKFVKLLKKI